MLWIIFPPIVILLAYLCSTDNVNKNNKKVFEWLIILILSYIIGMSGQVSTDHSILVDYYTSFNPGNFNQLINTLSFDFFGERDLLFDVKEPGYVLLVWVCRVLHFSEPLFFFVLALITNTLLVKTIFRYKYAYVSMLIYITSMFFYQEINLVRQVLAVSIFAYSTKYLQSNQNIRYLVGIAIATMIHYSAIYLSLFVFINYLDVIKRRFAITIGLSILLIFSYILAFKIVSIPLLEMLSNVAYYSDYLNESRNEEIRFDVFNNFIAIISLFFLKDLPKKYICIYILFVLGVVLQNCAIEFYMFFRFALYFVIFYFIFVPDLVSEWFHKNKKLALLPLSLIFLYYLRLLFVNFVFNNDVLIGQKMYNFTDLFK